MYIPKRTRLEMFLKRKVSTSNSSCKNKNTSVNGSELDKTSNANWSDTCAVYIKDFVLKRRNSSKASRKSIAQQEDTTSSMLTVETNLCFDQLSEFQRSYISFPEFNESSISNESPTTDSECSSNAQGSWRLTSSFSFSSYTSSNI